MSFWGPGLISISPYWSNQNYEREISRVYNINKWSHVQVVSKRSFYENELRELKMNLKYYLDKYKTQKIGGKATDAFIQTLENFGKQDRSAKNAKYTERRMLCTCVFEGIPILIL